MIENQLPQLFQGLITQSLSEVMNRNLIPLLSRNNLANERLLTYTEATTKLRISKPTFIKLLRQKRLRTVKIDRRTFRIDPKDLEQFIENQKASTKI